MVGIMTVPFRILPRLDDLNRPFWQGGERGELVFLHCAACQRIQHPPQPICAYCRSHELVPRAVSGRARLATFTVNHQVWMPGPELPYVVAIVELEEDPTVRLTTNLVGCAPEAARVGQMVRVVFEHHADSHGDVWLPLFELDPERDEVEAVSPSRGAA